MKVRFIILTVLRREKKVCCTGAIWENLQWSRLNPAGAEPSKRMRISVFTGGPGGGFHHCLLSLGHSQGRARRERDVGMPGT